MGRSMCADCLLNVSPESIGVRLAHECGVTFGKSNRCWHSALSGLPPTLRVGCVSRTRPGPGQPLTGTPTLRRATDRDGVSHADTMRAHWGQGLSVPGTA